MNIVYTLQPEDLFAFYKQRLQSTAWMFKFCLVLIAVAVPALLFLDDYAKLRNMQFSVTFALVSFLILSIVAWAAWVMMKRLMKRAILKQSQDKFCVHRVTLTDTEVSSATDHSQSRSLWSAIYKVDEMKDHILIYTSPGAAYIIPKRAFATPDQMREFYQMAVALQKSAKKV